MVRIVVFDSGLGSLSVIKPIQQLLKCSIIYFADSANFPYGKRSITKLQSITQQTVSELNNLFKPDITIIGSNTLSLVVTHKKNVIPVLPPLYNAKKLTNTKSVCILATNSIVNSNVLDNFIKKYESGVSFFKINASPLVDLVETGKFYSDPMLCKKIIKKILNTKLKNNNIDVATLSSTHLPFLLEFFQELFPDVYFLDPSKAIAKKLKRNYSNQQNKKNSLQIFTSGSTKQLEKKLYNIGIKNKVRQLKIKNT